MTESVDCVVIGAGVVGLAVARALAQSGREVIVLEGADMIGSETSSRNSEVIHAGIYYPVGSLKAEFCIDGKNALYEYCSEHGVPHRRCGKIIVATDEDQVPAMHEIKERAAKCGVTDLEFLTAEDAKAMEPELFCHAALMSPSTGIIDTHTLMLEFLGDTEAAGGMIAYLSPVESGAVADEGIVLNVGGETPMRLLCRTVINSAGIHAPHIAGLIEGMPADKVPTTYLTKGNYYSLTGKTPFSRLVYPAPTTQFLGVHITIDIGGQARFGPDVEHIDTIDYDVDPRRSDGFYEAVRRYWPGLKDGALQPAYSGIRPRITPPGAPLCDFVLQGPGEHGVHGLVNLLGIESPGLTSSMAIADRVVEMLGTRN
ncbi:MAG: FAD-dependent oxidoreductase [Alphaproteobacteria bacterium]|nr:FAD-dependent oxidoreductase [Alphaproteobacteria bacterium]